MSSYLRFARDESVEYRGRKTEVWQVVATRDGAILGRIKWFGRWRQYAFFPSPDTVFNPECLDSINAMIRKLMEARRAS